MKKLSDSRTRAALVSAIIVLAAAIVLVGSSDGATALVGSRTYTLNADFGEGILLNVNHDAPNNNQLQLNATTTPFPFIWIALSGKGTIVKVDTATGTVLGEYLSAPDGRGRNPSRTTVDLNGNVWSGNRNEAGSISGAPHGSAVKIGLEENNQCVDRNGNTVIDTSTGLGNILAWPDITDGAGSTDGAPHVAQVQDAADECILIYQRLPNAENVRHVSVDVNNDVWVGGYPFAQRMFHKLDENTGAILSSFDSAPIGCGGYGGFIDGNNILWSASISQNKLLRYDLGSGSGSCIPISLSYGLGIDTNGFIWNAMWTNNTIMKVNSAGAIQAGFPKSTFGASNDRGVAVTPVDNHVWVANSGGADVSRLDNSGNLVAVIPVGNTPTGVAVDAAGKVWVTNLSSNNAMRIDPGTNSVDLTVPLGAGAAPYNYSDMTGIVAIGSTAPQGTWMIIFDSEAAGTEWGTVSWNIENASPCPATPAEREPAGTSITVRARSAESIAGLGAATYINAPNNADIDPPSGRYLQVEAKLTPDGAGTSPILCDLTIEAAGAAPTPTTPPGGPPAVGGIVELVSAPSDSPQGQAGGSSSSTVPYAALAGAVTALAAGGWYARRRWLS